jgi:hypothetical protein
MIGVALTMIFQWDEIERMARTKVDFHRPLATESGVILRRTKVGAGSYNWKDPNGCEWWVSESIGVSGNYDAYSYGYPDPASGGKASVTGKGFDGVQAAIDAYAYSHPSMCSGFTSLGLYVDENAHTWKRIDQWTESKSTLPVGLARWRAEASAYGPGASVTANTEIDLVSKIQSYASAHKGSAPAPVPGPGPKPAPSPGPSPAPGPTPKPGPAPAPSPVPPEVPVANAGSADFDLVLAGLGVTGAVLLGRVLL